MHATCAKVPKADRGRWPNMGVGMRTDDDPSRSLCIHSVGAERITNITP